MARWKASVAAIGLRILDKAVFLLVLSAFLLASGEATLVELSARHKVHPNLITKRKRQGRWSSPFPVSLAGAI